MITMADRSLWKLVAIVICAAILTGLLGGVLGAPLFLKNGEEGEQGIQGEPGVDGINSIQQIISYQNLTSATIGDNFTPTQWYNISVIDTSMNQSLNISDQSRILAEFATTVSLSNSGVWFRVVIDNQYISTVCYASSAPNMNLPINLKILTDPLSAGQHTIEVQFYRVSGTTTLLDRSLYLTELPAF